MGKKPLPNTLETNSGTNYSPTILSTWILGQGEARSSRPRIFCFATSGATTRHCSIWQTTKNIALRETDKGKEEGQTITHKHNNPLHYTREASRMYEGNSDRPILRRQISKPSAAANSETICSTQEITWYRKPRVPILIAAMWDIIGHKLYRSYEHYIDHYRSLDDTNNHKHFTLRSCPRATFINVIWVHECNTERKQYTSAPS